jgi:hypothetical protein
MDHIILVEELEAVNPLCLQIQCVVQFFQGLPAIGFEIPQCMIQIEKQVLILHAASYEIEAGRHKRQKSSYFVVQILLL